MALPTVREVWRLALPTTTEWLNANGDLDRQVQWARRMASHAPAFVALEEGDLALMSIKTIRLLDERLTLTKVVQSLAGRGIAALVVVGDVSEEAIQITDRHGICMLGLPSDADLRDIEKDVVRLIVEREAQLDRRGRQIYRQLAQFSIEDHGLPAISEALLQIVGKPVIIQDERLDIRALAWTETCPFSTKELTALLADRAPLHRWLLNQSLDSKAPPCTELDLDADGWARCVAAVVIEGKLSGYLSIVGQAHDLDDLDRLAAERGSLVCAVEMAKQRAVEAAEQRLRGDFLDMLLTAGNTNERALARHAAEMDYELEREHAVVLFGLAGKPARTGALVASEFRTQLLHSGIQIFLCPYEDDLAALCSAEQRDALIDLEEYVCSASRRIAQLFPQVHIAAGIGKPGTALGGLRRSFAQAQESLALARDLFDGERVVSFGDLSLYHLLCRLQDCDELPEFYGQTLAPLATYDAGHDTELVTTLEAFFAHHGNVSQTAESLHLHRNSLLYRLERIGEIAELDLDDVEDRFSLQLALKLQPFLASSCGQKD